MEQVEAEVVGLKQGCQELLTRVNDLERSSTHRWDELSRAYTKAQGDPKQGRENEISESKAVMSINVLAEERAQYKE